MGARRRRRRRRTGDNNGCSWAEGGQSSSGNEEDGGGGFPSWRAKGLRGKEREGPPTSRAQRRYLAEGKSLRGHPRRLLRSSSGLPYFRVQPRKVVCCPLSVREPLPRRVYPRDEWSTDSAPDSFLLSCFPPLLPSPPSSTWTSPNGGRAREFV